MNRDSDSGPKSALIPLFGVLVQLAALGLCTWAMSAARNRGRELPPPRPDAPPTAP